MPESPPLDVGCEVNPDCPVHKACFNRICRDPCVVDDPCGLNAFCRVDAHQAVCRCPEGYLGNPRVECKLREYSFQGGKVADHYPCLQARRSGYNESRKTHIQSSFKSFGNWLQASTIK